MIPGPFTGVLAIAATAWSVGASAGAQSGAVSDRVLAGSNEQTRAAFLLELVEALLETRAEAVPAKLP